MNSVQKYRKGRRKIASHGEDGQSRLYFISFVPTANEIHAAGQQATLKVRTSADEIYLKDPQESPTNSQYLPTLHKSHGKCHPSPTDDDEG